MPIFTTIHKNGGMKATLTGVYKHLLETYDALTQGTITVERASVMTDLSETSLEIMKTQIEHKRAVEGGMKPIEFIGDVEFDVADVALIEKCEQLICNIRERIAG